MTAKTTKKAPGKAIVKWDEELAKLAAESTAGMDLPTAKFLSIRGGQLSFGGVDIEDNELRCVILAWVYENQYYQGRFDPSTPQVPVCYAFSDPLSGNDKETMAPLDNVTEKQNDACATCQWNEYETSETGRGKACKNVLRLALIAEDDLEDLSSAEVIYFKVPVTSVKNFLAYAKKDLKQKLERPLWSVITLLEVEKDNETQVKVTFKLAEDGLISDNDAFQPLKDLWQTTQQGITFPYPAAIERTAVKPKGKTKPAKFTRR